METHQRFVWIPSYRHTLYHQVIPVIGERAGKGTGGSKEDIQMIYLRIERRFDSYWVGKAVKVRGGKWAGLIGLLLGLVELLRNNFIEFLFLFS